VLIYRAMEWPIPRFAHVSLILGQDRTKLSKRHGATSVSAYAEAGFLADAMVNYLTLLGWSAPDGRDVFDRDYAIANFALDRVNSAPAVFDPQKFEWLNGQYIHAMSAEALRPLVVNAIGFDTPWLEEAIDIVKTSVHLLPQFAEVIRFVTDYAPLEIDRAFATAVAAELREHGEPLDADAVKAMNERLKKSTGLKGKELFMPLRLMLTGMDHGPELVRAIPLLARAGASDPRVLSPLARVEQCIR
jgi:nondiscriminating glutamyl-tRNA synthetase